MTNRCLQTFLGDKTAHRVGVSCLALPEARGPLSGTGYSPWRTRVHGKYSTSEDLNLGQTDIPNSQQAWDRARGPVNAGEVTTDFAEMGLLSSSWRTR